LFYYAGHGIQVDGTNYIIPIDAKLENKIAVRHEAVSVNDVVAEFEYYQNNTNIVILDACRDNPFRSWSRAGARGFKAIKPSSGTIIAFATSEGATAADGKGSNGLYTTHLVKQLKTPQRIVDVFNNTRVAVEGASAGKQSPQEWTKLKGAFYFKKPTGNTNTNNTQPEESGFTQGNVVYDYGSISIDSKIAGSFYIDGKYKGTIKANSTGNKLTKITTGTHTLKLEGDETWTKTITVYKDQTKYVSIKSSKAKDLPGYLTDSRDGKRYKKVEIGSQVWMAENLAFETASGSWAYKNDQSNVTKYGYLYNWETAKKVCPSDWRLPTKSDFETLLNNYGGSSNSKANYTALIPNGESGFSASFGGWRDYSGYDGIGKDGNFWSSSARDGTGAWRLYMDSHYEEAFMSNDDKSLGSSVRCIQDN